jgi:hypothetical protein
MSSTVLIYFRPAAAAAAACCSAESAKRAKQLSPEGPHPLLLAKMQQQGGAKVDMQVGFT